MSQLTLRSAVLQYLDDEKANLRAEIKKLGKLLQGTIDLQNRVRHQKTAAFQEMMDNDPELRASFEEIKERVDAYNKKEVPDVE